MKAATTVLALVLAALVAAAGGYFVGTSNQHTTTFVSVSTATSSTTSTTVTTLTATFVSFHTLIHTTTATGTTVILNNSVPSVQLFAKVAPVFVVQGGSVSIEVGVYNPLPAQVSLSFNDSSNPSEFGCASGPVFLRVFAGHYIFANLSLTSPLLLYNASIIPPCPAPLSYALTFAPNSDQALSVIRNWNYSETLTFNDTTVLSGYWINCCLSGPGASYILEPFPPGPYTVLAYDSWGQQEIAYFEVT